MRVCDIEGCENKHEGHGFCSKHYQRFYKAGKIIKREYQKWCSIPDCENKHYAKGYCSKHWGRCKKYNDPHFVPKGFERDGHTKNPAYPAWATMKRRCFSPTSHKYHRYGGRGITVCNRWNGNFNDFIQDMGERPEGMSLDRINNNGHYSCGHCEQCMENGWPMNCRWADNFQQANNRENNLLIKYKGKQFTISEWERKLNFRKNLLHERIVQRGWTVERAFNEPLNVKCRSNG